MNWYTQPNNVISWKIERFMIINSVQPQFAIGAMGEFGAVVREGRFTACSENERRRDRGKERARGQESTVCELK